MCGDETGNQSSSEESEYLNYIIGQEEGGGGGSQGQAGNLIMCFVIGFCV